jgi:hypothetical protein
MNTKKKPGAPTTRRTRGVRSRAPTGPAVTQPGAEGLDPEALAGTEPARPVTDRDRDERLLSELNRNLERDPHARHREGVTPVESEEDGVADNEDDDLADVAPEVSEDWPEPITRPTRP